MDEVDRELQAFAKALFKRAEIHRKAMHGMTEGEADLYIQRVISDPNIFAFGVIANPDEPDNPSLLPLNADERPPPGEKYTFEGFYFESVAKAEAFQQAWKQRT
jgi:hypothetical protein